MPRAAMAAAVGKCHRWFRWNWPSEATGARAVGPATATVAASPTPARLHSPVSPSTSPRTSPSAAMAASGAHGGIANGGFGGNGATGGTGGAATRRNRRRRRLQQLRHRRRHSQREQRDSRDQPPTAREEGLTVSPRPPTSSRQTRHCSGGECRRERVAPRPPASAAAPMGPTAPAAAWAPTAHLIH